MILQALCRCYAGLRRDHPDEVPAFGWERRRVDALVELDDDGSVIAVDPLEKMSFDVPKQAKRTSTALVPNALCDTGKYMLGVDDGKCDVERLLLMNEASRDLHRSIVEGVDSPAANALRSFCDTWDPSCALENPHVADYADELRKGKFVAFSYRGALVFDYPEIRQAWDAYYDRRLSETAGDKRGEVACEDIDLVTGKLAPIARLHPAVKGFGRSTGASLVSFNQRAFESWGLDGAQGLNAPTSVRSAFEYTAALTYLINSPAHRVRVSDDLIYLFWAERDDTAACSVFGRALGSRTDRGASDELEANLRGVMRAVQEGKPCDQVDLDAPFYVLGLRPSGGRLAVVLFEYGSMRKVLARLGEHYGRLMEYKRKLPSPWRLIQAVRNQKVTTWSSADTILHAKLVNAVLTGAQYPPALYVQMLQRVRKTVDEAKDKDGNVRTGRKVTSDACSIARMFLIKNYGYSEEDVTMGLNPDFDNQAYLFGRLFAVLEFAQYAAHGKRVSRPVVDKFFNAASSTPLRTWATLNRYAEAWLRKLEVRGKKGSAVAYRKQIEALQKRMGLLPSLFTLQQRGLFQLGYFQEREATWERIRAAKDAKNSDCDAWIADSAA